MSQAASVGVTLDSLGRVTDITVGGHSISAAIMQLELHGYGSHQAEQTYVAVILPVDEVTVAEAG